jgi:hypothetical protein
LDATAPTQRLPASPPTSPPTAAPAAATPNESDDEEQQNRADGGVYDRSDKAQAEVDAELGQQPSADEGANDSDDEVADDSKSGALHEMTCQPSGNETDQKYDEETFTGH